MYEQRAAPAEPTGEPRGGWAVRVHLVDGSIEESEADSGDWYVVVDDLEYGRVVFDAARWPRVDASGRLVFGPERAGRTVEAGAAQQAVDAARERRGQPTRPLRIGDAFHVRGEELPREIAEWRIEADVTRAAREASKLALFAAVAPRLRPEEERLLPARRGEAEAREDATAGGPDQAFPTV